MGDRFYLQQQNKRKRKMPWTDESKAEAIESYTDANPTPETSMEIVKQIADDLGESPNGVRMILTKAGVYLLVVLLEALVSLSKQHRTRWLQLSQMQVQKLTKTLSVN